MIEEFFKALLGDTPIERILIGIFIIGIVAVSKLLLQEKDKRVNDAVKVRDDIAQPIKEIKESIERMEGKIVISKKAERNEQG